MLRALDIRVRYGTAEVVRGVSFRAKAGEVTVVIGPNGSGKSTLLRALTGELRFRGEASLNGLDIARARAHELAALRAVLSQSTGLSFPFTVHEVVKLGLSAGVWPDAERDRRVQDALAAVDLAGFGGRFYQELSGGEQQRVQLARVLAQVWEPVVLGQPRYLFLDEPTANLDIKHQIQVMQVAVRYARRGGGVFAILHDLNVTAAFADHIVLLHDGRVFAVGPRAEVLTAGNLERVYRIAMSVGAVPEGMDHVILPKVGA